MTNDFRSYNVIYDRKNENHWPLLITRCSLLITRNTNTREKLIIYTAHYFMTSTQTENAEGHTSQVFSVSNIFHIGKL